MSDDYPFLSIMWTMVVFFAWIIWFWLLITVLSDVFRRRDLSGWGKTGWIVLVIVLPYLGVFIYLISQGHHMAERNIEASSKARAEFDEYVRTVAEKEGSGGAAAQIEQAHQLLQKGAITQEEYDALKQKALS